MADDNMIRMQQEAAERVRQMQARARRFTSEEPVREQPQMRAPEPPPVRAKTGGVLTTERKGQSLLAGLGINAEQDQLLLLLLAVVLAKNDAPIELLLALLYIAM